MVVNKTAVHIMKLIKGLEPVRIKRQLISAQPSFDYANALLNVKDLHDCFKVLICNFKHGLVA
jgi:hypothetical protein